MTDIKEINQKPSVDNSHEKIIFLRLKAKSKKVLKEILIPKFSKINLFLEEHAYPKTKKIKSFIKSKLGSRGDSFKSFVKKKIYPQAVFFRDLIKEQIQLSKKDIKLFAREKLKWVPLGLLSSNQNLPSIEDEASSSSSEELPKKFTKWTDHSASLNQGRHWSSAIIALCTSMFIGALLWAFTARIDQTITVRGRLQPSGAVREVESPSAGVVSKVFIQDGDVVTSGQPLFIVEAKGLASRRAGLENTLKILDVQASSLKRIINSEGDPSKITSIPPLPEISDIDLYSKLLIARQESQLILSQLSQIALRLESRTQTQNLQKQIAEDMKPLYEVGAISRNQYLNKLNQVQEVQADVQSLQEERIRVVAQAAGQLNQLNRQIISLRSELVQLGETLEYRTVKAPIDGKIFDAKVSPYSVVNGGASVLKIVPDNRLEATVQISNKDIGFVKSGMSVNLAVDSFPSGEFGYLEGTLVSIGSDALPPNNLTGEYTFPATISIKQQEVESGGKSLNLQSGMGINANIKLRSRPVISLFTDLFTKQLEGVSRFR